MHGSRAERAGSARSRALGTGSEIDREALAALIQAAYSLVKCAAERERQA